jgi:hemerythrin superfamily protein
MDIFEHLKRDHRHVADLMHKISATANPAERRALFLDLREALLTHAKAEEATFYSTLAQNEELEDLIAEARDDHRLIERLLSDLDGIDAGSDAWTARFDELKETVEEHVEEEEHEIFDEARDLIDDDEAHELDQRMSSEEDQIRAT